MIQIIWRDRDYSKNRGAVVLELHIDSKKVLNKYKKRKSEKFFEGNIFMELLEYFYFPISMSFEAFSFCLKSQKN